MKTKQSKAIMLLKISKCENNNTNSDNNHKKAFNDRKNNNGNNRSSNNNNNNLKGVQNARLEKTETLT